MTTPLGLLDSGGSARYDGFHLPPVGPPPGGTSWPPPDLTGTRPTMAEIIAGAGLYNESALPGSPSATSITVTTDGALLENLWLDNAIINVKANDVTVRNCRVHCYAGVCVVRLWSGYSNLLIEGCDLAQKDSGSGQAGQGVVGNAGEGMFVYDTELHGFNADGAKGINYSLFERCYIHMEKSPGSSKHLDGIQITAKSHCWARRTAIVMPIELNGNSPVIIGPYVGGSNDTNYVIEDLRIEQCHLLGGNTSVVVGEGKPQAQNPTNPTDPYGYFNLGTTVIDNVFYRDFNSIYPQDPAFAFGAHPAGDEKSDGSIRYGWLSMSHPNIYHVVSGNEDDTGTALPAEALLSGPDEGP